MNKELENQAFVSGDYLQSNVTLETEIVNTILVPEIKVIKKANKGKWYNGNLCYEISILNSSGVNLLDAILIDMIDIAKVDLLLNTICIDGIPLYYDNYTYDVDGKLSIKIHNISNACNVTFEVKKKKLEIFKLDNIAILNIEQNQITSNIVTVYAYEQISPCRCKKYLC